MGEIGDLGPQGSIVFGVFVGLVSTSIQSLGLTLQRKSHILEDEKSINDVRRPPYRRRRWQIGMAMFIFSNIVGSTIQITTLPLPALSALQASGLVFNSICATLILKEPFTRYSLAGTILVSIGAVLIATFGAIGEPAHDLTQLLTLIERAEFLVWVFATGILVGGAVIGSRALKTWVNNSRTRLFRGMAYGFISGILSAHSLLLAKSAVELVVRTIADHVNQFNRWQSWMILLGLAGLALGQLYYLHRGLKLCSTSVLYPFVFCIYNIIAILDGLIYFNQASQLSVAHSLLVVLGTLVLLSGVISLSWRLDSDARGPQTMDADLADLAYQLDSDASSVSSSLSSPTEQTALLSKLSPPVLPTTPSRPMQTSPGDLESGAVLSTESPELPATQQLTTPYGATRRSVHWEPASRGKPPSTSTTSPRHERDSVSPSATRLRSLSRRQAFAEADALWDELQDEPAPAPASGPSAGDEITPSLFTMRTRSRSLAWQESRAGRGTPSPEIESPRGGRASPAGGRFSPGPLMRTGTGRSYRRRISISRPGGPRGYGALRTGSWNTGDPDGGGEEGIGPGLERRVRRMWRTALDAVVETVSDTRRRSKGKGRRDSSASGFDGDGGAGRSDGGGPSAV